MHRALVFLAALLVCVACGTTTLTGAKPTPSAPSSPTVSVSPIPSPTPAPPPDYGPPPAGVDLFYLQWPAAPTWMVGFDWTGKPRATVHLTELDGQTDKAGSGISVAPNGTAFSFGGLLTFDRLGRVIYRATTAPTKGGVATIWSEDGQLQCGVETQSSAIDSNGNGSEDFYLVRRSLTGAPEKVAKFLHLNFVSGDMGYGAVACSRWLDRALLERTVCCSIQGALVLRLSDGVQLGAWTRDGGQPVFSPDGQVVADPTWSSSGQTVSTEVRLVLGGTVLARYGPGVTFRAFSGDNRFAVITAGGQTQVVQVATRRVLWTVPGSPAQVLARPFSGDLVLTFNAASLLDRVVIVHPDGTSRALDGTWIVPMSWGSGS